MYRGSYTLGRLRMLLKTRSTVGSTPPVLSPRKTPVPPRLLADTTAPRTPFTYRSIYAAPTSSAISVSLTVIECPSLFCIVCTFRALFLLYPYDSRDLLYRDTAKYCTYPGRQVIHPLSAEPSPVTAPTACPPTRRPPDATSAHRLSPVANSSTRIELPPDPASAASSPLQHGLR